MRFLPTEEQQMLRQSAAAGFARDGDAADLGLAGMLRPEAEGGLGMGLVEASIVMHEAGRAGVGCAFAAQLLFGDAVPAVADGAPVALPVQGGLHRAGGRLRGRLTLDAPTGELRVAVPVDEGDEIAFPALSDASLTPRQGIVLGVQAGEAVFDLAEADTPIATMPGWRDQLAVLLGAWMVGAADRAFDTSLTYMRDRNQFGQPIGANQALKHIAADTYLQLENIRVTVDQAAATLDAGLPADLALTMLRATVPTGAREILETTIHLHGGIGLTWDYGLNAPLRGILRAGQVIGEPTPQLQRLCDLFRADTGGLTA